MTEKWYDLSQPIVDGDTVRAQSFPPPSVRPRPLKKKFYRSVSEYTIITHVGTHMDAPIHYFPEGKTIDAFPLEKFIGEGVILDVPKRPLELIDVPDLERGGLVREGDIVMLCTGWGRRWPSPEYHEHPYLTEATGHWLVRKKVKLVGIDFPTVDLPQSRRDENYNNPVHHVLLSQEVLIIENLADMSAIAGKRAFIVAVPLKLEGGDGVQVRPVARVAS